MPELGRAASRSARQARPAAARQRIERGADRRLVVLDDRVAVRRLVTGQAERVERERVRVRRRALLLDQATEDTDLDRVGVHLVSLCGAGSAAAGVRSALLASLNASGPPETHYVASGDVQIAYQAFGAGPDLLWVPGWV